MFTVMVEVNTAALVIMDIGDQGDPERHRQDTGRCYPGQQQQQQQQRHLRQEHETADRRTAGMGITSAVHCQCI